MCNASFLWGTSAARTSCCRSVCPRLAATGLGYVTVALQTLHWIPVRQRIAYKLCTLMHGVAFGYAPTYLLDAVVSVSMLPGRPHLRL